MMMVMIQKSHDLVHTILASTRVIFYFLSQQLKQAFVSALSLWLWSCLSLLAACTFNARARDIINWHMSKMIARPHTV